MIAPSVQALAELSARIAVLEGSIVGSKERGLAEKLFVLITDYGIFR